MAKRRAFNNGLVFVKLGEHKVPDFQVVRNEDWIKYGSGNSYPDYLVELADRSATHSAILNGKVSYILGEGWHAGVGSDTQAKLKINSFINNINADETLNELAAKNSLDFEMFDGLYIEVIRNKQGNDFSLHYLPFNKMRTNKDMDKFWFSNDWSKSKQTEEKTGLKEFKAFDPDNWEQGDVSTVFYFKILKPRKGGDPNVYPLPTYIGGTQSIETEIEAANYNLVEIKTGFKAGTMINFFNGQPSDDAKSKIKKQITDMYSGTDNAGAFILNFTDGKERGSEVIALNGNDLPERYSNVKKDAMKSIFTSHRVSSPALFGVQQDGVAFGTAQEVAEQYELFQNTYISQRQQILERIYNNFASLKGIPGRLVIKPTVAITPQIFTEATIKEFLPRAAVTEIIAERLGVDLKRFENASVTTTTTTEMQADGIEISEDLVIEEFSRIGLDRELFEIIDSKPYKFDSNLDTAIEAFADDLPENEDDLTKKELLPLLIPKTTKKQEKEVEQNKIEIRYSYELRKDAPALKAGGKSRDFCRNLIAFNRLYTRLEIDGLTNDLNTNVWLYKGGWYTNPNTDVARPQCRHIWMQHIVRRK